MGSRTWIKVYCDNWIQGTLREETPEIRGVWVDLLALAGSGQYGDTGEIKLTNGVGYTDGQIAEILHISKSLWRKAQQRLLETERIGISPRGAIRIVNWSKYQSEYNRQKPYRQQKQATEVQQNNGDNQSFTPEQNSPFANPLEKEIESEKESKKLQDRVTGESYNQIETTDNLLALPSQGENPPETPFSHHNMPAKHSKNRINQAFDNKTWKSRIEEYLKEHGASSPTAIASGLGLPLAKYHLVNLTLSQNKGKVFASPQRGLWDLQKCCQKP